MGPASGFGSGLTLFRYARRCYDLEELAMTPESSQPEFETLYHRAFADYRLRELEHRQQRRR